LLDTQILLWQIADDPRLSGRLRETLLERSHDIVVSDVTLWEVVIKNGTGKLTVPLRRVDELIEKDGYSRLSISRAHIYSVGTLELLHRDPFDRLLIAQAKVEKIPILTADKKFAVYDVALV
jgi:PIN domain nuclease of toxin-antitoxin system